MEKLTVVVIFGLFAMVLSQQPFCEFADIDGEYTCTVNNGIIFQEKVDDPIDGLHIGNPQRQNSDVKKILTLGPASEFMLKRIFNYFTELETIIFASGDVKRVAKEFFYNCTKLTKLTMDKGGFTVVEEKSFENCGALTHLTLRENTISTFASGAFDGLGLLEELDLSNNQIRTPAPGIFNPLVELKVLKLSNNAIDLLPETIFARTTKLEILYLDFNNIKELKKAHVAETRALTVMSLSDNKLDKTQRGFFDGLSLTSANFLNNECITKNFPTVNQEELNKEFEECFRRNGGHKVQLSILVGVVAIIGLKFI